MALDFLSVLLNRMQRMLLPRLLEIHDGLGKLYQRSLRGVAFAVALDIKQSLLSSQKPCSAVIHSRVVKNFAVVGGYRNSLHFGEELLAFVIGWSIAERSACAENHGFNHFQEIWV